jgi:uncharacterized protein
MLNIPIDYDVFSVIVLTSFAQSIFGTGVLMFGTPILMILGYDFQNILLILLPTSILINIFQLNQNLKEINLKFYKRLLLFSILPIVIMLYFCSSVNANLNLSIGCFLILTSLKDKNNLINKYSKKFIEYESLYLVIMGTIHGLTNLGGTLLSGIVFSKKLSKKSKRSTIAACYLTFALFQLSTLTMFIGIKNDFTISYILYWITGPVIFLCVEKYIYFKINETSYIYYSNFFIFTLGLTLVLKN